MTRSLASYEDIKTILDQALAAGGGEVELPTSGQAVRWRQRAYEFRKLMRSKSDYSIYDRLTLNKLAPDSPIVKIAVVEQPAIFTPAPDGKPITAPEPPAVKPAKQKVPATEDDLQSTADLIAKTLRRDLF